MFDKERSIMGQNAGTAAAAIHAAEISAGLVEGWDPDHYRAIRTEIYNGSMSAAGLIERNVETQAQPSQPISDAFPGAQVIQHPAAHAAEAFQPAPPAPVVGSVPSAPLPQPGQVLEPGNSKTDQLWQEFFADPSQWHDNRANKRNPNGPDFRHKTKKDENGYNLSLWIGGKYPAPAWVKQRLGVG